jgi:hypothetical protein
MGRVWLARDETLHRDVAVKEVVLPRDLADAERYELQERTLREARAAGRLSHPNVVAVYDVVQAEDRPWIVMELVRSRSLYEVIRDVGPVPPRRAAEIGLAVLGALTAAHEAGVWHRDVKPGNVLLADDGRVVLTDFGLATYDGDGAVTRSGLILGSAQYIAPERARDGASGPESDMWSLGATLYAAVEGRSPYARESSMATLTALATQPPDPPRRAGPLRPILMGLLRKNPRHRMRPAEAERLLRKVLAGENISRRATRAHRSAARRPATAPDGAAAPAVGTVAAAGIRHPGPGPQVNTHTEETYRYQSAPRRRWPLVLAVLGVVALVPVGFVAWTSLRGGAVPEVESIPSLPAVVVTAAMGVQACAAQPGGAESAVPDGGPARPGEYGLLAGWTYYRDPGGFHVAVPQGWRLSRVDRLVCFRDPGSPKAIAVLDQGALAGDPVRVLADGEPAWRDAAQLTSYRRVALVDAHYDEGAADLEYTYERNDLAMHGKTRMLRLDGRMFTLFWLTTEFSWSADQALVNFLQPSFGLDD